jgi:hypothetical protein
MSQVKLRLGPLPRTETAKMTIAVSIELKEALERYASLHSQAYGGPIDAVALIPHMLEAFMARDRAFRKSASARGSPRGSVAATRGTNSAGSAGRQPAPPSTD